MSKPIGNQENEITFLIPDISGFTKFLKTTEISHSKHIIEELMNLLIKETKELFQIAEVEGDALFLYQFDHKIDVDSVYKLVQNAFKAFHKHLINYNHLRICNCGACSTAVELSVKFVLHYGKVEFVTVNGKEKPYGIEVIKAHRLLKNDIDNKEYLLFSDDFKSKHGLPSKKEESYIGKSVYPEIGELNYTYTRLGFLKKDIKPDLEPNITINQKLQTIANHSIKIDAPVNVVYEVLSEYKYRPIWNKEAKVVDHNEDEIYQVGTEHFCIINNKKFKIKTVSDNNSKTEFGEQFFNNGLFKEFNLYFIFNKTDQTDEKTKLTIEIRVEIKAIFKPLINWIFKPKLSKKVHEMSLIIKGLSEEIHLKRGQNIDNIDVIDEII